MVVNSLIDHIKSLGFSEYEARAYVCLLSIQPAGAYEISQASGIPSSKIYEVISRLVDKQVFMPDGDGKKRKFLALLPDEFIERQKSGFQKTMAVLEKELPELRTETPVSFIWNIRHYDLLMEKAERMIRNAEKTVLLSCWNEERDIIEPCLAMAEKKGVKISAVNFGRRPGGAGMIFQHPIEDTIYQEKGGRGLVLIADLSSALVGTIDSTQGVHGAFSANQGFITLAEDYIKHDIYIMKIVTRFQDVLIRTFGDNFMHLRNIFEDEDIS